MSRVGMSLVCAALALVEVGCASQAVGGSPEAAVAAALQQYRRKADSFTAERRAVVRDRLALRLLAEEDAARVRAQASARVSVWRIAGDKELLDAYQRVVDASREGGEAIEALDRMREESQAAVDKSDTRMAVRAEKLAAAGKALSALAEQRSLAKLVMTYLAFLRSTDAELKKLRAPSPESPASPASPPGGAGPTAATPPPR